MRAHPSPIAAAVACALVVSVWTSAPAAATATGDRTKSVTVEILDAEAAGLDRIIAAAGASHRVDVAVRITNTGTRIERDIVARAETNGSAAMTAPVELAPGQTVTTVLGVEVSGLPGAARDIVISAGGATADTTHRQVPWLLVGAGALAMHIGALTVRDRLRARLVRAGAVEQPQPSPNQTWARSSR